MKVLVKLNFFSLLLEQYFLDMHDQLCCFFFEYQCNCVYSITSLQAHYKIGDKEKEEYFNIIEFILGIIFFHLSYM